MDKTQRGETSCWKSKAANTDGEGGAHDSSCPPACCLTGAVTPSLTPQMVRPESLKQPIYGLSLSACVKEGEN